MLLHVVMYTCLKQADALRHLLLKTMKPGWPSPDDTFWLTDILQWAIVPVSSCLKNSLEMSVEDIEQTMTIGAANFNRFLTISSITIDGALRQQYK